MNPAEPGARARKCLRTGTLAGKRGGAMGCTRGKMGRQKQHTAVPSSRDFCAAVVMMCEGNAREIAGTPPFPAPNHLATS